MKNRFILAPMTNQQSNEDGSLSEEELKWLAMRAKGQFGMVMTCASHVQESGKGFPRQLGIFSDDQNLGHQKLTKALHKEGSLAVIQLYHGGMRSAAEYIKDDVVSASKVEKFGARGLTLEEVKTLKDDFVHAAVRAKQCGYDGIQVHGAHGYLIAQFLSSEINKRNDEYGGSFENRNRLLFEIIIEIREKCGPDFLISVRLSPERFGMKLQEVKKVSQQLIDSGIIDLLDISLWDCSKTPIEEDGSGKTLLAHFEDLDFKNVIFTVAGKISSAEQVMNLIHGKVDAVSIGRAAILLHDFPVKVTEDSSFVSRNTPVPESYLAEQGLSMNFINYMRNWKGFVLEDQS